MFVKCFFTYVVLVYFTRSFIGKTIVSFIVVIIFILGQLSCKF